MKFHWFHLMPWPYLPADMRERYDSVYVTLPAKEVYDPVRGHDIDAKGSIGHGWLMVYG